MSLVFLDFETTGLDPRVHQPIELAAVVTDDALREIASFETLITPTLTWERWEPEARIMHTASGLARECVRRGRSVALAQAGLRAVLAPYVNAGPLHLAGNSVHFDRGFLAEHMPDALALFHHRLLDVSSLRLVGERFTTAPRRAGEKPHRAMADVRRSIAELKHWVAALRGAP